MIDFLSRNWFQIIIAGGVIYSHISQKRKNKKFEENCFNTLKNKVETVIGNLADIKKDISGMECRIKKEMKDLNDKTFKQEGDIRELKGKMNGIK